MQHLIAASKQVLRGTLRPANATQTETQSDDYRHSLWLPHHRASVWRPASFWVKMWFENNDFCCFWDTVCTITQLYSSKMLPAGGNIALTGSYFFKVHSRFLPPPSSSSWRLTLDSLSCLSTCSGRDGSYPQLWRLCCCDCGQSVFLHVCKSSMLHRIPD